jgi:hypothetical protein
MIASTSLAEKCGFAYRKALGKAAIESKSRLVVSELTFILGVKQPCHAS